MVSALYGGLKVALPVSYFGGTGPIFKPKLNDPRGKGSVQLFLGLVPAFTERIPFFNLKDPISRVSEKNGNAA